MKNNSRKFSMKKVKAAFIVLFVILFVSSFAQLSNKEIKSVRKSTHFYDKGNFEKAIKSLTPVISKNSDNGPLWNIYTEYFYRRYVTQRDKETGELFNSILKDKKHIDINASTSKKYLNEFLNICSKATLFSDKTDQASMYLRIYLVDLPVDTAIKNDATLEYHNAETAFENQEYLKALELYKKAIEIDSTYFRATLYAGDCYWLTKRYEEAITYYKKAIELQPVLLEPRKFLTDAYISAGEYEKAMDACIDGLFVYPDVGMFNRLDSIAKLMGKTFDRHWISRKYSLNQIRLNQADIAVEPWSYYREAKSKMAEYCDESGVILKQNDLSQANYLEVYSWENMLAHADGETFDFAKKMKKEGFLDCYVFISLFHYSSYDQFCDFISNNRDKAKYYIKNYLLKKG
jgi:tetratricopeptide (TPR) repeat protein